MDHLTFDHARWASHHFRDARLGNSLRNKRLVKLATQLASDPSASLPQQTEGWSDLKAAYRFFDAAGVTFEAVATPHWRNTRAVGPGRYLVLSDTTEIDFGPGRAIPELSVIGNGKCYGFLLHSALVVSAHDQRLIGLGAQAIHYRKPAPEGENSTRRLKRDRESELWGRVIDAVGRAPEGAEWLHVMDRGADNFEAFCHCQDQGAHWVVRASHLHRKVIDATGTLEKLSVLLGPPATAGSFPLKLRARPKQPARTAELAVRFVAVRMPPPSDCSPYLRRRGAEPIPQTVVHVREVDPPRGTKPIDWVLYTSLPVTSLADAIEVVSSYEQRWLIEEWHKALKTGCRVEDRQLKAKQRLEPLVAVLSVVAVRLLQLKSAARTEPDRPVERVVPRRYVALLAAARKREPTVAWTVGQFYRELARLGGFLGRRHDGDPGWITIWRGWEKLWMLDRGAEMARQLGW